MPSIAQEHGFIPALADARTYSQVLCNCETRKDRDNGVGGKEGEGKRE